MTSGTGTEETAGPRRRWPHVMFALGLGSATSLGTLALAMTTGDAYVALLSGMVLWIVVMAIVMFVYARRMRHGLSRYWPWYLLAWAIAYGVGMWVAATSAGKNLAGGILSASVIALVALVAALVESLPQQRER